MTWRIGRFTPKPRLSAADRPLLPATSHKVHSNRPRSWAMIGWLSPP